MQMLIKMAKWVLGTKSPFNESEQNQARSEIFQTEGIFHKRQKLEAIVNGRHVDRIKGMPEYMTNIKFKEGMLHIRIDDTMHPEFWLQVSVSNLVLIRLIGGEEVQSMVCKSCGETYFPDTDEAYCSETCRQALMGRT